MKLNQHICLEDLQVKFVCGQEGLKTRSLGQIIDKFPQQSKTTFLHQSSGHYNSA